MINKINQRRAVLQKKRQHSFKLDQSVKDMVIPQYNALRDPFLNGFFNNPQTLKHLKYTGVLPKKRRFSLKHYKELLTEYGKPFNNEDGRRSKKCKSESKVKDNNQRLPNLSNQLQTRKEPNSEDLNHHKRYYKSKYPNEKQ